MFLKNFETFQKVKSLFYYTSKLQSSYFVFLYFYIVCKFCIFIYLIYTRTVVLSSESAIHFETTI